MELEPSRETCRPRAVGENPHVSESLAVIQLCSGTASSWDHEVLLVRETSAGNILLVDLVET